MDEKNNPDGYRRALQGPWNSMRKLLDEQIEELMKNTKALQHLTLRTVDEEGLFEELAFQERPPLVGRFVEYHLAPNTGSYGRDMAPAVITHVWSEKCVDLTVFPDFARPFRVPYVEQHEGPQVSPGREWSWAPEVVKA